MDHRRQRLWVLCLLVWTVWINFLWMETQTPVLLHRNPMKLSYSVWYFGLIYALTFTGTEIPTIFIRNIAPVMWDPEEKAKTHRVSTNSRFLSGTHYYKRSFVCQPTHLRDYCFVSLHFITLQRIPSGLIPNILFVLVKTDITISLHIQVGSSLLNWWRALSVSHTPTSYYCLHTFYHREFLRSRRWVGNIGDPKPM